MSNIHNGIIPAPQAVGCILQSYNAFDQRVAHAPDQTLNFTQDFRNEKWNEKQVVKSPLRTYNRYFNESRSAESASESYSNSVGIKGSYGFFSASVKYNSSTVTTRSSTSFHSSMNSMIHQGTVHLKNDDQVLEFLDEALVKSLRAISSFADAEEFTKKYGTHVITSINLGGLLSITTDIEAGNYSKLSKASIEVTAKYSGAVSIEATANAASEISNSSSYGNVTQITKTIGGNAVKASQINSKKPETIIAWAQSCESEETVFGINDSKEYWTLIRNTKASDILQKYLNLVVLAQSIKNPTIFSAVVPTIPYKENVAIATVSDNFKIISGGVHVNIANASYLTGCYPQLDDRKKITGWKALSHDLSYPSSAEDTLTAYAIGVYDPLNLLDIIVQTKESDNHGIGISKGEVKLDRPYIVTGGGCSFSSGESTNLKFVIGTYPENNSWKTAMSDYEQAAKGCTVTTYGIGLAVKEELRNVLSIGSRSIKNSTTTPVSHGDVSVSLNDNIKIASGGVSLSEAVSGNGNLVKQCFPASNNQWKEYNTDLNGSFTRVMSTVYALSLTVDSPELHLGSKK